MVKEPSKREIQSYFTKAIFVGETWEDVRKKRKITVIAKPKGSATNTIILAVESLERPGSNNKTIYKRFTSKEDRKGNKPKPGKVWAEIQTLDEKYKDYILIYENLWKTEFRMKDVWYAKMAACTTDGFKQQENDEVRKMIDKWKGAGATSPRTRGEAKNRIKVNFGMLEETVDAIHGLNIDTLDIKAENLFFECGLVKRFVIADLDLANLNQGDQPVGETADYVFGYQLTPRMQDKFALYVSFIEILAPKFFSVFFEKKVTTKTGYKNSVGGRFNGLQTTRWMRRFPTTDILAQELLAFSNEQFKETNSNFFKEIAYKGMIEVYIEKIGKLEEERQELLKRAENVSGYLKKSPDDANEMDVKKAEDKKRAEKVPPRQYVSAASIFRNSSNDDLIKTLRNKLKF